MTRTDLFALLVALFLFSCPSVFGAGSKGYDEDCNPLTGIASYVGAADEAKTCNEDKHLICVVNKCKCNPAYSYESGWLGLEFLMGGCKKRAAGPCTASDTCVSKASCTNNFCICNEGYSATIDGECSSGAAKASIALIPFLLIGWILKYLA